MKKTFVITMFGKPFDWIQQYIDGIQHLAIDGWEWKIFTPEINQYKFNAKGNVEIIPMTSWGFNELVEKKLSVKPNLAITETGIPNLHITDFYIFSGVIFEDYLKESDYWGITNMDVVYGRLSRFFPDSMIKKCKVFSDDVNTINGVFSLFRNTPQINTLFRKIPFWKDILAVAPCKGCLGTGDHTLYGADEYVLTQIVRGIKGFATPKYYPMLSHDRLEQHFPMPKLVRKEDGALFELFKDIDPVDGELSRPMIGREIPYFHFSRRKKWPLYE